MLNLHCRCMIYNFYTCIQRGSQEAEGLGRIVIRRSGA